MKHLIPYTEESPGNYILDAQIRKYLDRYYNLHIGGKKVSAPYFINTQKRKDLRSLVGKGTPEEIVMETKVWAQAKKINLKKASVSEIRKLMLTVGIGIDCSGFLYHALDAYFRKNLHKRYVHLLTYEKNDLRSQLARLLRPAENVNANTMSGPENCLKIENIVEIRPGDFIRGIGKQRNAYHIAIVSKVTPTEIEYMHSHRNYGDENGVRVGRMVITDPTKSIHEQDWQEVHSDGNNYLYEELTTDRENSGFRRLNIFS